MYEQIMEKIGKSIVYNICTLGTLIGITQLIPVEAVVKVLEKRIPKDFLAMNHRALDIGLVLGSQYQYKI
jgi:2-oxoglutarate ferredoxin oxidoreductase subunit gamma